MITAALSNDKKLTGEDRKMLDKTGKYLITFDKDSPELAPEMERLSGWPVSVIFSAVSAIL